MWQHGTAPCAVCRCFWLLGVPTHPSRYHTSIISRKKLLYNFAYTNSLGAFFRGYGVFPSAVFHGVKKVSAPLEDHFPDELAVLRVLFNHLL